MQAVGRDHGFGGALGGSPRGIPYGPRPLASGRVGWLAGNVGYLRLESAGEGDDVIAELDALATARALLIDVRDARGTVPGALALLASWLFDTEPLHVDAVYSGAGHDKVHSPSIVPTPRARYIEPAVYVLVG